jgi:hypothetical protein
MLAARLAGLLALLFLNVFGGGLALVQPLRLRPLERLCAAAGASIIALYLGTFLLYVSGAAMGWCAAGSAAALAGVVLRRHALAALIDTWPVRRVALGFLMVLAWTLAHVAIVRHFGGGGWGSDWLEHFHRCLYFLHRLPPDVMLAGKAHLAARPPLMNLVGAFFLAQTGDDFECFQLVFAFLNTLPFLACALLAGRLYPAGARRRGLLVPLLALCPLFVTNVTYTWTKLLSAFFVLLALHFYLAMLGQRRRDSCVVAWPLALAAAVLVHYSAGVFALFIAGHHVWTVLHREAPRRWPVKAAAVVPGLLLLSTWILFSLVSFGVARTVGSNSSVGDAQDFSAGANALKIALNVVDTLVPHPFRGVAPFPTDPERRTGEIRDYFFLIYQTSVIAAAGSVAGLAAVALFARRVCRRAASDEARFWRGFVPFVIVAGVATHGGRDLFGVTHVTLQPLVLLAVTLVAAGWPGVPRAARAAIVVGGLVDFGLGIALHHHVESLENTAARQVFDADLRVDDSGFEWRREGPLPPTDWHGWYAKHAPLLLEAQLERARRLPAERARKLAAAVGPEAERLARVDATDWGGWWARQGRQLTFIGDDLARSAWAPQALVVAALLWFLTLLLRAQTSAHRSSIP